MLDEHGKLAIQLLRSRRQRVAGPTESPDPGVAPAPAVETPPPSQGLFIFERRFQISNQHFKKPNHWHPLYVDQNKARFERMKLPIQFHTLCYAAQAVVTSGFGCSALLHLQLVPGHLQDTTMIQQEESHLGVWPLVFDGQANPMAFLKVCRRTKGPDILVRAESGCPEMVELTVETVAGDGAFECKVSEGEVRCVVPRGMKTSAFVDRLAQTEGGRYLNLRLLLDEGVVDTSCSTRLAYKPNCHSSACKRRPVEPYQGLTLIAMMARPEAVCYEVQLSAVCSLL